MHRTSRVAVGVVGLVAAAGMLAGCGKAGSSGTAAPPSAAAAGGCAPVAGTQLVVLDDDKHLQNTDNIIPAVNAKASSPELLAALNKVSAALDTPKLVALNKATDVDHKSSAAAAADFAQSNNLTSGITKGAGGNIVVGAANFSENQTVAELYKIVLVAAGYNASTPDHRQPGALRAGPRDRARSRSYRSMRPPSRSSSTARSTDRARPRRHPAT